MQDAQQIPDIRAVLNLDTWLRLTKDERRRLSHLLPLPPASLRASAPGPVAPGSSEVETAPFRLQALTELFSGADMFFGNPLLEFASQLQRTWSIGTRFDAALPATADSPH